MNIAILVDLELSENSGGHVKFWERICNKLKKKDNNFKLTVFFLGKKKRVINISKQIQIRIISPILSSKILKLIGIDADYTDLSPINLSLFFLLRKFDLFHTTDQLYCMANTAKLASKIWKKPLTTSYHTDAASYSKFYVEKICGFFPKKINYFFVNILKVPQRMEIRIKNKIRKYFRSCRYAMIDENFDKSFLSSDFIGNCKISKLSRGVDLDVFKIKEVNRASFFRKYDIPLNDKLIFFCGRIHELKGAILLSKIHKTLSQKGINITTVLAGQKIEEGKCQKIGGNKLKIVGYLKQEEVASFYNICDLFVFPSLYETGPQVVLEAKACNAICVVSPSGGGRKIKKNGFDGIIIEKYDERSWTSRICDLLMNKKENLLMKKNLKKYYKAQSWENVFKLFFINNWKLIIKKEK